MERMIQGNGKPLCQILCKMRTFCEDSICISDAKSLRKNRWLTIEHFPLFTLSTIIYRYLNSNSHKTGQIEQFNTNVCLIYPCIMNTVLIVLWPTGTDPGIL